MLEIRDIYKTFNPGTINEKRALRGVSLTLEDGDFVTVIGGNGVISPCPAVQDPQGIPAPPRPLHVRFRS